MPSPHHYTYLLVLFTGLQLLYSNPTSRALEAILADQYGKPNVSISLVKKNAIFVLGSRFLGSPINNPLQNEKLTKKSVSRIPWRPIEGVTVRNNQL